MMHLSLTASLHALSHTQRLIRRWVLGSWLLLLMLVASKQLLHGPVLTSIGWALMFSAPLWLALPGLWRGKRYTHQWATLCVLPYFVVGITEGVANSAIRLWALALLGAALLWFFALLAYLRISPRVMDAPTSETTTD